jgi:hypothetical protein
VLDFDDSRNIIRCHGPYERLKKRECEERKGGGRKGKKGSLAHAKTWRERIMGTKEKAFEKEKETTYYSSPSSYHEEVL